MNTEARIAILEAAVRRLESREVDAWIFTHAHRRALCLIANNETDDRLADLLTDALTQCPNTNYKYAYYAHLKDHRMFVESCNMRTKDDCLKALRELERQITIRQSQQWIANNPSQERKERTDALILAADIVRDRLALVEVTEGMLQSAPQSAPQAPGRILTAPARGA